MNRKQELIDEIFGLWEFSIEGYGGLAYFLEAMSVTVLLNIRDQLKATQGS